MHRRLVLSALLIAGLWAGPSQCEGVEGLPIAVGTFQQQYHTVFTTAEGLPSNDVRRIAVDEAGVLHVETAAGFAAFAGDTWKPVEGTDGFGALFSSPAEYGKVADFPESAEGIRDLAEYRGEIVVAAARSLSALREGTWDILLPGDVKQRWAPLDVRGVAFTPEGELWFASPQGVGSRGLDGRWTLYTGADGLPYNDFTCVAAGPGGVWFGTTNGAIQFAEGEWRFRQGRRWLIDNHVNDIAVTPDGAAWIATSGGVSRITSLPMTLAEKAAHFEREIDARHRRTEFGYVADAVLSVPGLVSSAQPSDTDNDGHFTGIYLGSASLGYAVTRDPAQKEKARKAFEALAFLSKVTEGGSNPAPIGFIARAVRPTSGSDPNLTLNPETDRKRREERDDLWKIMDPRWPVDESGKWYWKCDSSSDELDGYYFGFGLYYDLVCESNEEREALGAVVRRMTDHLLDHDYNMVDHDGQPTRWGHFSPKDLNQNEDWWFERGLNSLSILTFLKVAHHITGEERYDAAYYDLIDNHGYAMNLMTSPKIQFGPGSHGQADDNMAMLNYYHLLRYETNPNLLSMYHNSLYWYWNIEKYERNPFYNFVYAACMLGKTRTDHWGTRELSPPMRWLEMAADTLKRYPIDLVDWPLSNAHRIDLVRLGDHTRDPGNDAIGAGHRNDGLVYPIDENHAVYWGDDPWTLSRSADGTRLRDPVSYLVAYYLGRHHGYLGE